MSIHHPGLLDLRVHFLGRILAHMNLGTFGIWQPSHMTTTAMARDIEQMGFPTLWISGESPDLAHATELLSATDRLTIGTSIVNIWQGEPKATADAWLRISERFPDR